MNRLKRIAGVVLMTGIALVIAPLSATTSACSRCPSRTDSPDSVQLATMTQQADVEQGVVFEPKITFEKTTHDFGTVPLRSVSIGNFPFTNTGTEFLSIERFHTPCGCSVPELPKRDYAPGESGIIQVRYSAPSRVATNNYPVYVFTNAPQSPRFELRITAKVAESITISPTEVSLRLDQDNAGMPALTVKSIDGEDFSITAVMSSDNAISLPVDQNKRRSEFVLRPNVDLAKLNTTLSGNIQIQTDHPLSGTLNVKFEAKPLFVASPLQIVLQNIELGKSVQRDVWIRSNYDQKVQIDSYTSTNEMMTIDSKTYEGNDLKLTVKIIPAADTSSPNRRFIRDELKIRLISGDELSIRCNGWFRTN